MPQLLGKLRQEGHKFECTLGNAARPCLNMKIVTKGWDTAQHALGSVPSAAEQISGR